MMSIFTSELTLEDFGIWDWQGIVENSENRECRAYSSQFFTEAKRLEEQGNQTASNVCLLLGIVTGLFPNWDIPNEPFRNGFGTAIDENNPAGVTREHWQILLTLVADIRDPELRARVADVLWVLRVGDYQTAELAIRSYLETAQLLENPEKWTKSFDRIHRAFQLSNQLGGKGGHFDSVIVYVEEVLDRLNGEDPLWFSHRLMALLLEAKVGDPTKYAALAEKIASNAASVHDWRRAREYWEIEVQWLLMDKLGEDARRTRLRAAETYVKEAKDRLSEQPPNYLIAARELALALEALRRMNAPSEFVDQVHKMLLESQERSAGQMQGHSFSVDITDLVNNARKAVSGKPIREAILFLAQSYQPNSVTDLRRQVLEYKDQFPLSWLIPIQQVDEQGRVSAIRPGFSFGQDQANDEEVIRVEMYRHALSTQGLQAAATVSPVLYQINAEHYVRLQDVQEFVVNNPFIPPGRENIYARGLHSGLTGDFLVATHLLLPQVENSLRYLLYQHGVINTRYDAPGIQDKYDLGKLLFMPEVEQILGTDLTFELQGLLVNRFGANLRNLAAHGLLNAGNSESGLAVYFWWVTLFICCHPALVQALDEVADS